MKTAQFVMASVLVVSASLVLPGCGGGNNTATGTANPSASAATPQSNLGGNYSWLRGNWQAQDQENALSAAGSEIQSIEFGDNEMVTEISRNMAGTVNAERCLYDVHARQFGVDRDPSDGNPALFASSDSVQLQDDPQNGADCENWVESLNASPRQHVELGEIVQLSPDSFKLRRRQGWQTYARVGAADPQNDSQAPHRR